MGEAGLKTRDLTYQAGAARLVDLPDLRLSPTGTTVIMGPNGAGKSLVLRLFHGLIRPDTGEIMLAGRGLDARLRGQQALVFQKPVLLRRSARANLDFVLKARGLPRDRTPALLEQVGLAAHGERPARRLSGGEQQRLAIARALATDPEMLLLDEPTASLDPAATLAIERILGEVKAAGVKLILVTHDLGQARRMADEVVFLARGRVVEQGPAEAFFAGPETEAARAYLAGRLDALVEE